jgi:hypothetical protein
MTFDKNLIAQFDFYFKRYQEVNKFALDRAMSSRIHHKFRHDRFRITDAQFFIDLLDKDELSIYSSMLYATNLISQVADFHVHGGRLYFNGKEKNETYPEIMGILSDYYRHVCPSIMPLFILKSIDPINDYWDIFKSREAWLSNKIQFDACIDWCCIRMDDLLEILSTSNMYKEKKYIIIDLLRNEHKKISLQYL